MRRRDRRYFNEYELDENKDVAYMQAERTVKRLKGFYVHLAVYLIFNTLIICLNYFSNDKEVAFWSWQTFSTALFWGIGLLGHGCSVFGRQIVLNGKWEERKIKELMDKERNQTTRWD